jgi:hypothetical protein
MMSGVEARLDGGTLVVRIPMRFQRRGGRKRIVAPDGTEIAPTNKPQPDGTLVKALARAWRWQRMLDDGVYTTVSEIGDAENISKSYVSRILWLALLAPDVVESILAERRQIKRSVWSSWSGRCRLDETSSVASCQRPAPRLLAISSVPRGLTMPDDRNRPRRETGSAR